MKQIILIAGLSIMVGVPHGVRAQPRTIKEAYLTDGSIVQGTLLPADARTLKQQPAGGSETVIPAVFVDTTLGGIKKKCGGGSSFVQKPQGYYSASGVGMTPGTGTSYYQSAVVQSGFNAYTTHGYRFHYRYLLGGTLGIDALEHVLLQLLVDFRYEPLRGPGTPYLYGMAGYGFDLSAGYDSDSYRQTYRGGPVAGAGIGARLNLCQSGALLMDMGYRYSQRSVSDSYFTGEQNKIKYGYKRILVRLGFAF